MKTLISLGAGVQSTTMALMATAHELTPMPEAAIFADTGAEPRAVYEHLQQLIPLLAFPVYIVRAWEPGYGKPSIRGTITSEILAATRGEGKAGSHSRPPFYTLMPNGAKGIIRRQCTGDYKVEPIQKKIRELLGLRPKQHWPKTVAVEQWIGISRDEATRMKPSQIPAIKARWPLIEIGMTRQDCVRWLTAHGYPEPPKSACTFCPFHSNTEWRKLKDHDQEAWDEAVMLDKAIRHGLVQKGLDGALFVHPDRVPLDEVDLSTPEERGQLNLFENECEGMCGV